MIRKSLIVGLAFNAFANVLSAQGLKGWSITPAAHFGKILKHTPNFTFEVPETSFGTGALIQFQTYGQQSWHAPHGFPKLGIALEYFDFGSTTLGTGLSFMPHVSVPVWRNSKGAGHFIFGSGMAWLNERYHQIYNPTNNAISTHWNNITSLRLSAERNLSPIWTLLAGISFTHFSNGATSLPNKGLNLLALNLGVRYQPISLSGNDFIQPEGPGGPLRHWGVQAHFSFGFNEFMSYGGPKYPVYNASLGLHYHLNEIRRLTAGLEAEYLQGLVGFGLHTFAYHSREEARQNAYRLMAFVAYEFLFGNFGAGFQAGGYLHTGKFFKPKAVYNKLMIRYYLPAIGSAGARFHLGLYLKSHVNVAEYTALGVGIVY